MKALFESILDIDSADTDANVIRYLSNHKFRDLYKSETKIVRIDKDMPICIIGDTNMMRELCENFKAKNIDLGGLYPEIKIKKMGHFASHCKNLIDFKGPDAHENYSELESLEFFFCADNNLKSFDLKGISESIMKIEYIGYMFMFCSSIENIDLSYFNFSDSINASYMFSNCTNLRQINLGDSKAMVDADNMCRENNRLKEFNAPNMILSGDYIFHNCESLERINVRYVNVLNSYYNPFINCTKLKNVNIYGLNGKYDSFDLSWAISLSDKSWDFLFKNLGEGNEMELKLPDTPKKKTLLEKYKSIAKRYDFILT